MNNRDVSDIIDQIHKEDARYDKGAYFFVRQALEHTLKAVKKEATRGNHHVSGQELLEGIRQFALEQYGPMTYTLFDRWGVRQCADFGDMVFHLVDYGLLGKTEHDRREDFAGGYDFREAFVRPFEPRQPPAAARRVHLEETGE